MTHILFFTRIKMCLVFEKKFAYRLDERKQGLNNR